MQEIKEKLSNISLLLVMTSDGDTAGIGMLLEICQDIRELAQGTPECERLVKAIDYVLEKSEEPEAFQRLKEFVPLAITYCDGNSTTLFPHEINGQETKISENKTSQKSELTENLDTTLINDYEESHLMLLEDFEGWLMELREKPQDEELTKEIARYIHTLKGDSGAVGLHPVEKVCHTIESIIADRGLVCTIEGLMKLKVWVSDVIQFCTTGSGNVISGENFLKEFSETVSKKSAPAKQEKQTPKAKVEKRTELPEKYKLTGEMDILLEFATEAEEHLGNVESVILESEGHYTKDSIDTIFRGVHSIKGGSAYFSVSEMTQCSHILENLLVEVRDGKRELDQGLSKLLLSYIDIQKDVLERARTASSKDGELTCSEASKDILTQLYDYREGKADIKTDSEITPQEFLAVTPQPKTEKSGSEDPVEQKTDKGNVRTFLKVETGRLDTLVEAVGEMVIYSSMLIRLCRELLPNNREVMNVGHRVEKFSRDLQDIGMSMRLVPIKGLFQKMSRLVWDVSKKLGKNVIFTVEGEDTELDRNLIDKIADPLMHMVRNSLDHGIELPEERIRNGKSAQGNVKLSSFQSGGQIHICIEDDGRGINPEIILAKGIEKGLVNAGDKISETEIFQLIFAAGFSTAAQVTDISGRGVGMDVVRKNVESLRGKINIESKVGKGSKFTIELPLTLAIVEGIQLAVGTEHFIMPSLSILEFVKPKPEMITNTFDCGETFYFRGKFLPVFRLGDLFGIPAKYNKITESTLVIVESREEQVAFMVDEIQGECSTVIKNLGAMLGETEGLAGCAIMPRGEVALILDVSSLVSRARKTYGTIAINIQSNSSKESLQLSAKEDKEESNDAVH